ncbi:MAG: T9SS type A sorting domain-containing protein [Bacteroidetes bacterium]|nr:T9SS type A sorting domain-containing protein [Bacteroidota bacterium]
MKKLIPLLFFLLPVLSFSQQNGYKSSPLDYAWKEVGNTGFTLGSATYTGIAIGLDGTPYVVTADGAIDLRAGVMKFNGTYWDTLGTYGFSPGQAGMPCLAISPAGEPVVAFMDYTQASKASVMKFDGTNWVFIGDAGFTPSSIYYSLSLAFNPVTGLPAVAFTDWSQNGKVSVMNFNGSSWTMTGSAGFSVGNAVSYTNLTFNTAGEPYVSYVDSVHSYKITVMKFDGANWGVVGNEGFSTGAAMMSTLAVSPAGEPYVAFPDNGNETKVTVMKFNGSSWAVVGTPQFKAPWSTLTSIAFSPLGIPYVAFTCSVNPYKAAVMKFNGTDWSLIGPEGFSAGEADHVTLAFSPSGQPYVAYVDWGNSYKATVMKYDSVYVGIPEAQKLKLSLYPDPASSTLTIGFMNNSCPVNSLDIEDAKGTILFEARNPGSSITVDVGNFPAGVYFVKLTTSGSHYCGKFCKK